MLRLMPTLVGSTKSEKDFRATRREPWASGHYEFNPFNPFNNKMSDTLERHQMNNDHASNFPALADYRLFQNIRTKTWGVLGPDNMVEEFPSHDSALYFAQNACEDNPSMIWGYLVPEDEPKDEDNA